MCLCLSKLLFYHCPSSSFPLLSFFLFPLAQSLSESLTPISLQLKLLHYQFIFFFLSSCLSACTCVCVCVRACPSIYLSLYLSWASTQPLQPSTPQPTTPPPPPQLPGRDPTFNITAERSIFSPKCASFCGNVEYVESVQKPLSKKCFFLRKCWICWICWMFLELTDPFWTPQLPEGGTTFNITAERSIFFKKCASFCGNVGYVEYVWQPLSQNVLISGEMLCWICWMFLELIGLIQKGSVSSKSIQHIQPIQHFPRKKHFFESIPRTHSTYSTFQLKEAHFWKNMLLTAVMLNVALFSGVHLEGSVSSKNIQHNQHIQHYSWKKHFFREPSKNTFNIFNISAERSTFLKNVLLTAVMLNVALFSGVHLEGSVSSKNIQHNQHIQHYSWKKHFFREPSKNTFNIFNISAERTIFCFLCLERPYFCNFGVIFPKKALGLQK